MGEGVAHMVEGVAHMGEGVAHIGLGVCHMTVSWIWSPYKAVLHVVVHSTYPGTSWCQHFDILHRNILDIVYSQ